MDKFTDRMLIDELKRRGYRVAKADRIRMASVQDSVHVTALVRMGKDHGYLDSLRRNLGASLGCFLMESGAVAVREEIGGEFNRIFRATATVVVDNPEFDWPYPLKMGPPVGAPRETRVETDSGAPKVDTQENGAT